MSNDVGQIVKVLKVLANETRLQILCELMDGEKTVSLLGEKLSGITQSALSQHLALLRAHGVVACQKNGQSVTYRLADLRMEEIIATLKRNFCVNP